MKCPNPACGRDLFKVRVVWKQKIKGLPHFLPVALECAHCHRQIKAYVLNEDVREMVRVLSEMESVCNETRSMINNLIGKIERDLKKPWWKFW